MLDPMIVLVSGAILFIIGLLLDMFVSRPVINTINYCMRFVGAVLLIVGVVMVLPN